MSETEKLAQVVACLKNSFEFWISEVYLTEDQWEDAAKAVLKVCREAA